MRSIKCDKCGRTREFEISPSDFNTFFLDGRCVDLCESCNKRYTTYVERLNLERASATLRWLEEGN